MFTGIVDHGGEIMSIHASAQCATIWVKTQFDNLQLGESIAVDGVCLTVAGTKPNAFMFEISPETLRLTIAKTYEVGQAVNVERALQLSDRLGGHFVSGHVDQTAQVAVVDSLGEYLKIIFKNIHPDHQHYLIQKGSVSVNGVSLTINEVHEDRLSVMLIPHTLKQTNLALLKPAQWVNLEFDMVAKLIEKQRQKEVA